MKKDSSVIISPDIHEPKLNIGLVFVLNSRHSYLASEQMRAQVCSAALIVFPPGVFMTMTPFLVAASMSTLSTPVPARPTIFSRELASMMS